MARLPALCLTLLLLAGCAAQKPPLPEKPEGHRAAWQSFRESQEILSGRPRSVSLRAIIFHSAKGRTDRLQLEIWGNLDHPLRLDAQAGMAARAALVRETDVGWLAFYPQRNEAVRGRDGSPLTMGIDAPFSLADLARLLFGEAGSLLPESYAEAMDDEAGFGYAFAPGGDVSGLVLDERARPVRLTGRGGAWSLRLSYDGPSPLARPERLRLELESGGLARLRVREAERKESPWPAEALDLEIPPGARLISADW